VPGKKSEKSRIKHSFRKQAKAQEIHPPAQSLNLLHQRFVPFGYSTIEISGNFDITLSKYTNPVPICQEKILNRFPYISPWKLPGGLRNSREEEIQNSPHRDDSNARQGKLNNPPI
jgi:hypothetical protein